MVLFVGLGNPTQKYHNTRHNFGFMAIDMLIDSLNPTPISKASFKGELYKSNQILLLKPTTFMNLSGESVGAVVNFYKPSRIVVVHDELDIPLGAVKFKLGGSDGGHNGIKSIDSYIGKEYERVRLGIGKPENKSQITSFVLNPFSSNEQECVHKILEHTKNALLAFSKKSIEEIKTEFTTKKVCENE